MLNLSWPSDTKGRRVGSHVVFPGGKPLTRPFDSVTPFGLSLSKPGAGNALRQAQGEREQPIQGPGKKVRYALYFQRSMC
jgi:hypothetical protein